MAHNISEDFSFFLFAIVFISAELSCFVLNVLVNSKKKPGLYDRLFSAGIYVGSTESKFPYI